VRGKPLLIGCPLFSKNCAARPGNFGGYLSLATAAWRSEAWDDGMGLPEGWQRSTGLGARIMAHRAAMFGAEFVMDLNPTGGTFVKCSLSISPQSADNAPAKHDL